MGATKDASFEYEQYKDKQFQDTLYPLYVPSVQQKIAKISYDLIQECKRCMPQSMLSKGIQDELRSHSRNVRKEIVRKTRDGCSPLFIACKRGCVPIVEFLITFCDADIEQRGQYQVQQDHSFHYVTPFWCAVVAGHLPMVKYLIHVGVDINATSDSGSTPVRSACFMTHVDIVKYLVEHGADIKKPNINGGTCLINSVQSAPLCLYLLKKGAEVNSRDIQEKTALHYAIQEHRLETTKLLIDHGANPYAKSRHGDDALRTACLKGAHDIFDYLKTKLFYTPERIAEAHELIGSTFLDEHNETRVAVLHWRLAHYVRAGQSEYIEKRPEVPLRRAYDNAVEFKSLEELDDIAADMDAMRMQSLLICERILGIGHKDTLYRLAYRGASYADSLQMQRGIDLWTLLLKSRVELSSLLHNDTLLPAQALVRLMIDLYIRAINDRESANTSDINYHPLQDLHISDHERQLPIFDDIMTVFLMLAENLANANEMVQTRPVYPRQQENFDRILKCVAHLIFLLVNTAKTFEQKKSVFQAVKDYIVRPNINSAYTNDSLLHLCVSRLNVIESDYSDPVKIFPDANSIKLLLDCGIDVNIKNKAKSTALHVAAQPYNYKNEIIELLLVNGADLDQPNRQDERPLNLIATNSANRTPLVKYISLKCLAACAISKYKIDYKNKLPKMLEEFTEKHEP